MTIKIPSGFRLIFPALIVHLLLLCFANTSAASYLRIVVDPRVYQDSGDDSLTLSLTISNDGDEKARAVSISFPPFRESRPVTDSLSPKESILYRERFDLEALHIKMQGLYSLPFQILYTDSNGYRFSAPFVSQIVYGVSPTKVLFVEVGKPGKENLPVDLRDSISVEGNLKNVSRAPLQIASIEGLASAEIPVTLKGLSLPTTIAPMQSITFKVEIAKAGALLGSQYPVFVIVSGETNGLHFTEQAHLAVRIAGEGFRSRILLLSIFGAIILVLVGQLLRRRRRGAVAAKIDGV